MGSQAVHAGWQAALWPRPPTPPHHNAHLYELSSVMTTGMSAPPMQAVMWAPSRPDTAAMATEGRSRTGWVGAG